LDPDMTNFNEDKPSNGRPGFNPAIIKMVAEGGETFFRYLKKVNLSKESDILVLPSKEHYYYEEKELNQFKTIICLKKLNHIKHPGKFLSNLSSILQTNVNFIGCFSVDQTLRNDGLILNLSSRYLRRFINFLDSTTDHILSNKEVTELLNTNGFKVINMTEMNGLVYFCSQNVCRNVELMAS
jgi:hypothetical protein